jgi:hypothetical protein
MTLNNLQFQCELETATVDSGDERLTIHHYPLLAPEKAYLVQRNYLYNGAINEMRCTLDYGLMSAQRLEQILSKFIGGTMGAGG